MWILGYAAALLSGWWVSAWVGLELRNLERGAFAAVFATAVSGWLLFLFGLIMPLDIAAMAVFILCAVGALFGLLRRPAIHTPQEAMQRKYSVLTAFATTAVFASVVWFSYTHFLEARDGALYSVGYTWADLSLHTTLIHWFAHQSWLQLSLPIFPDAPLTYPFITNLSSAWLMRLGAPFSWSVFLPSVALLGSFVVLLIAMTRRVLGSLRAAWFTVPLVVFFAASAGISYFFTSGALSEALSGNLSKLAIDFANSDEFNLRLPSLLTSHLLPQRTFLLGSTVFFLIITLFAEHLRTQKLSTFIPAAVGVALLPLIHAQTAVIALVALMVYVFIAKNREVSVAVCIAAVVAGIQIMWQLSGGVSSSFIEFKPWWYAEEEGALLFWIRNIGGLLLLATGGFGLILYEKTRRHVLLWCLLAMAVLLFVVGNIVQLHPNLWDNLKILQYSFIVLAMLGGYLLARLSRIRYWGMAAALVLLLIAISTGITNVLRENQSSWVFASESEMRFAEAVRDITPENSRILVTTDHNHPVSMFSGREVIYGYEGWLWSYGIDYENERRRSRQVWQGLGGAIEARSALGVRYAAIHDSAKPRIGFNERMFETTAERIVYQDGWSLYRFIAP